MGAHSKIVPFPYEAERQRLIIWLLQSDQPKSTDLAISLARRGPGSPWGSNACPMLRAQVQAAMVRVVDTVLDCETPLTAVSWFPYERPILSGGLGDFDLVRFIATRRRALQRTFLGAMAFGVVNLSLHVSTYGRAAWVPEVRLLIEIADTKSFREQFLCRCRWDSNLARPVPFLAIRGENRAVHLTGVTEPWSRLYTHTIDRAGDRTAVVRSLSGEAAVEAALFLDRYPLESRLILRRLRRVHGRSGFSLKRST